MWYGLLNLVENTTYFLYILTYSNIQLFWKNNNQNVWKYHMATFASSLKNDVFLSLDIVSMKWYNYVYWARYLYCHRDRSDSCLRDFNLVSLICRLWNALSTSGGSVHVYRFSTIFAIDRVWFASMSMYSSWKRQLLLCESCFAEALELPLESFLCPDQLSRLCTTWTCVHSQKVVSGIRLCNCFLATLFAGKCLQIWQWTNCRILQLQNKK